MEKPAEHFWQIKLGKVQTALEKNNFAVYAAENAAAAKSLVLAKMLPDAGSVSWGGSMTFTACGLYAALKEKEGLTVIDTFDHSIPREEVLERRRQALLADLFITGTNAITEDGRLVNLDMIGNRVAALTFGPRQVVVLAGRNKIVGDVPEAMARIKTYAAPVNAMRLDKKTPCAKTGRCEDCQSPDRICNTWTITEKAFPKGRITVVLINADLGL